MKSKLEIYALSVCFATVVVLIISLGIGSYALVSIKVPSLTMNSYTYEQFQSNDSYWNQNREYCHVENCEGKEGERPAAEELTARREAAFEMAIQNESRQGFQTAIKSALFIFFASLALLIHWRIASKCRE